jgi:hypothetical protein
MPWLRNVADIEDADVRSALEAFGRRARVTLQDTLLGLYISGSLTMGDFQPASSDIDFLAVTSRTLDAADLPRIAALHASLAEVHPLAGRLEGAYAAAARLSAAGIAGAIICVEPGRQADLKPGDYSADNMWALRYAGLSLVGPPPSALLPEVGEDVVRAGLQSYLAELIERAERAPHHKPGETLLNMARCIFGIKEARACTKREAAEWLSAQDPGLREGLSAALCLRGQARDEDSQAVQDGLTRIARFANADLRDDTL